ncbi:MAG: hypothetical protein JKX92_01170 [Porticoccaceae bacterium]|nr:hypothetical protein [Porticoccaceae bacterium]
MQIFDGASLSPQQISQLTLKTYTELKVDEREAVVAQSIGETAPATRRDQHLVCMSDFAANKGQDLKFSLVMGWCLDEAERFPEKFSEHYDELADRARKLDIDALVMCKNLVKNSLQLPGSAEIPLSANTAQHRGHGRYTFASSVAANNQFGQPQRLNWNCDIQFSGSGDVFAVENWQIHHLEIL